MRDGGPIYCETDVERLIVEPWSVASELAFLVVIVYWARRLRGRWGEHRFVACALPVMFVGFVGGLLYHAFRAHRALFLLDVIPLVLLLLAAVGYLCWRLTGRVWAAILYGALFFGLNRLLFLLVPDRRDAIALSYGLSGLMMALPVFLELGRRAWRGARDVAIAVAAVAVGTVVHFQDGAWCEALPMGTHWLWHLFAAVAVHHLIRYLVRA